VLCVVLTGIVIVNLYFTLKLASSVAAYQPTEEAFMAGNTLPANIKRNGLTLGEDNAPVSVEFYSDFQCPYCRQAVETTLPQLIDRYVTTGKVKFTYQPYSFLGNESVYAAQYAYCANEQGKFWEYKEALFSNQKGENQGGFTPTRLLAIGNFVGLDMDQFKACGQSNKYAAQVKKDLQNGSEKNVQGTPTYFVNGKLVNNSDNLFQAIDSALKG
jgi:protein-disulfide isomerase